MNNILVIFLLFKFLGSSHVFACIVEQKSERVGIVAPLQTTPFAWGSELQYLEHTKTVLNRLLTPEDPSLCLALGNEFFPQVLVNRSTLTLTISIGTFGVLENVDQLAFLLARSIEKIHSRKDQNSNSIDLAAISRLIKAQFNPMKVFDFFDLMIPIVQSFKNQGLDFEDYANLDLNLRKIFAKEYILEKWYSEFDLSSQVKMSTSFPYERTLLYWWTLYNCYGFQFSELFKWNSIPHIAAHHLDSFGLAVAGLYLSGTYGTAAIPRFLALFMGYNTFKYFFRESDECLREFAELQKILSNLKSIPNQSSLVSLIEIKNTWKSLSNIQNERVLSKNWYAIYDAYLDLLRRLEEIDSDVCDSYWNRALVFFQFRDYESQEELKSKLNEVIRSLSFRGHHFQFLKKIPLNKIKQLSSFRDLDDTQVLTLLKENREISQTEALEQGFSNRLAQPMDFLSLIPTVVKWAPHIQWEFILFLTGHNESIESSEIKKSFEDMEISLQQVRQAYEDLPSKNRHIAIDAMLSHDNGLLVKVELGFGYTKVIVDHLFSVADEEARQIAFEILEAYMFALRELGLEHLQSNVLAYLLVVSEKEIDAPQILVRFFEAFGSLGLRVGQFMLAANLLSEEENKALRTLQDRSIAPTLQEVYEDLHEILGENVPYEIDKVISASSLKYVVKARDKGTGKFVVLKVLRKDAPIHMRTEEEQMLKMANYLVKNRKRKEYIILLSAIEAASAVVNREVLFRDEVKKSQKSFETLYKTCVGGSTPRLEVLAQTFLHDRLILADFVDERSIEDVSDAESKSEIAKFILNCEHDHLFTKEESVYFDPDRHPGNLLVGKDAIYSLDFDQAQLMTSHDRDLVVDLFALAQVLDRFHSPKTDLGLTALDELYEVLNSFSTPIHFERNKVVPALHLVFRNNDFNPMSAYYSLLAALSAAQVKLPLFLYDFPRGIFELGKFEKFLSESDRKLTRIPQKTFEDRVRLRVHQIFGSDFSFVAK